MTNQKNWNTKNTHLIWIECTVPYEYIDITVILTAHFNYILDVKEIFLENISDSDLKYKLYYKVDFEQETGSIKKKR